MPETDPDDVQVCAACGTRNPGRVTHCTECGAELGLAQSEARGTVVMEPSSVEDEGAEVAERRRSEPPSGS